MDLVIQTVVSALLSQAAKDNRARYDSICGLPYTALPLATVSLLHCILVLIRLWRCRQNELTSYSQ